jgi:hypothetical protein
VPDHVQGRLELEPWKHRTSAQLRPQPAALASLLALSLSEDDRH